MSNWLEEVKEGDRVVLVRFLGGKTLEKVEKVTAKQVVIYDDRFWKDGGNCIANQQAQSWNKKWLEEATDEAIAQIELEQFRGTVKARFEGMGDRDWKRFSKDQLERLQQILNEAGKSV